MKKVCFLVVAIFSLFILSAQAQTNPTLTETPVTLKTLSTTISGTLASPNGVSGKIPVVLIIAGTGPIDRNGNSEKLNIKADTYKLLAEALGKAGIASLRYDKRMVGENQTHQKEDNLRFDDYVDDAIALINMLKNDQRFSNVVVLGHGDGSLAGILAAADTEEATTAFISVEGLGRRADVLLKEQMKSKPGYMSDGFNKILDSLKVGSVQKKVDISLYPYIRPSIQNYMMSWLRFDPTDEIKKLKIPVLIVQGTTDLEIPVIEGDKLKHVRSSYTYAVMRGMNYVLRDAPADKDKNLATYTQPQLPLKPELVSTVVDFIKGLK
ncbi:alpha/beta hydrolase [Mucilaginibacter panaciglaebae]|uniref:Alpha/beta hydrolase n=1 Tax=Mucilaginibacter panaciglaebae TaxID=502331 RepID=A0ABP7WSX1_9SPHI